MKLQFLKESANILNEKTFKSKKDNGLAALGYRNAVKNYIKKEFINPFDERGYYAVLDNDDVLKIGFKKKSKICNTIYINDSTEINFSGLSVAELDKTIHEWCQELVDNTFKEVKNKFAFKKISESIINEGPINFVKNLAAKVAKTVDKISTNSEKKNEWNAIAANIAKEPYTTTDGNYSIIVEASGSKDGLSIDLKAGDLIPLVQAPLAETDNGRGYYFTELIDCNGNKETLGENITVEKVLQTIADKLDVNIKVKLPDFDTADARNNDNKILAAVKKKNNKDLNALYNAGFEDVAAILLGVNEDFSNTNTFDTYNKALTKVMGKNEATGRVISYIITQEFPKIIENDAKKVKDFIKYHHNQGDLNKVKDLLIDAQKNSDFSKLIIAELEDEKQLATNTVDNKENKPEENKAGDTAANNSTKNLITYNNVYKQIKNKLGDPTRALQLFATNAKTGKPTVTKQFKELVKIIVDAFKNE